MRIIKVFIIQAYEEREDTGKLIDAVTLELIDTTANKALTRAKKVVKKKFYRLASVIEKEAEKC